MAYKELVLSRAEIPDGMRHEHVVFGTANVPEGWWMHGAREDVFQSWEHPFQMNLLAYENQDGSGASISVDAGEAFVWYDRGRMRVPGLDPTPFEGFVFGMMGLPAMPAMPKIEPPLVPVPSTGRPERRFTTPGAYLEQVADESLRGPDGKTLPRRLVAERLVGDTAASVAQRERRLAADEMRSWQNFMASGTVRTAFLPCSVLSRTVMREWLFTSPGGEQWRLFIGARFVGKDLISSYEGRLPSVPVGGWEFGQAQRGPADWYQVKWECPIRFAGSMPDGVYDPRAFARAVAEMGLTARFSDALLEEAHRQYQAFAKADSEEHQRDIEGLRRLNQEMREDARRRDAISAWEDAQRRQRRMESDRRIREGWSSVIRGVEQYRDPYGHLVEVPIGGPGSRAYWDRSTGSVIRSDVSDFDRPYDWEPLEPWQW